jgi:hypothetical protein
VISANGQFGNIPVGGGYSNYYTAMIGTSGGQQIPKNITNGTWFSRAYN